MFSTQTYKINTKHNTDYVDSMDEKNYIGVTLAKPMGIVFEENDSEFGGIFVQSLTEDGIASKDGTIQDGDQLVTVGNKNVNGLDFDDALAAIIESDGDKTNLTLFRGTAKQFYGPTGPSKDWLTAFAEKGGKTGGAAAAASPPAEE
jgi:C-terminal processing protease CtpA/Prc